MRSVLDVPSALLLGRCLFNELIDGCAETVRILTTSRSEVGLTASAALHQLGSLANGLSHVDALLLDKKIGSGTREQRLAITNGTNTNESVLHLGTELEGDVLHSLGGQ